MKLDPKLVLPVCVPMGQAAPNPAKMYPRVNFCIVYSSLTYRWEGIVYLIVYQSRPDVAQKPVEELLSVYCRRVTKCLLLTQVSGSSG